MNRFLIAVSLAVCSLSLSVDAKSLRTKTKAKALATTTKQAICYGVTGVCSVNCDLGTVVVGGGCYNSSNSVGISASFPAGDRQWVCRPTSNATYLIVYAICQ